MVLGEVLLKITRSKVERNQNIYKSTLFQLSLQQLPGCFNQDSQEQIARQIVICRPLVSSGSFPPVQTNKQAALGYGQVGPCGARDWIIRPHEQDRAGCLGKCCSAPWPCPAPTPHKHPFHPLVTKLVASKRSINGEESRTKGSRGTMGRRVASHESIKLRSEDTSLRVLPNTRGQKAAVLFLRVTDPKYYYY